MQHTNTLSSDQMKWYSHAQSRRANSAHECSKPLHCQLNRTKQAQAKVAVLGLRHWARLAAATLLSAVWVSASHAALQTYTDAASFTPLLAPGYYSEGTWAGANGLTSFTFQGPSPANSFGMTFTSPGPQDSLIYVGNGFIGSNNATSTLTITFPSTKQPNMFGADAFGTDRIDTPDARDVTVTATSNLGATATLLRNKDSRFAGFRATAPGEFITQVTVSHTHVASNQMWDNIDNAFLGLSAVIAPTTSVSPPNTGTLACTTVNAGDASACTAEPAIGYITQSIGGCGGTATVSGVNSYTTGNLSAACTVTATFEQLTYNIVATPTPVDAVTAGGSVSCSPNPVNHGSDATCTATAQPGYAFGSWGDDCTGTMANSCTLSNVTTAKTVSANFTLNSYDIATTATPSEGGSVSCTPSTVAHGGGASCSATAQAGYTFASWAGDCTGTAASCVLSNVTANKAVTANFSLNSYTITTSANPPEGGNLSCTPNPVAHGSNATCTAVPAAGFAAASFSGCTRVGSTNDCALTNVTAAAIVSAAFTTLPVITNTGNLPDATEGQTYSQSLEVTGGTAPYTWAVVDGSLPPGMTLDTATGVISGTVPKQAVQKAASIAKATGAFSFSVQVTDSSIPKLQSTVQQLSLQVVAAPVAATATPVPTMGTWALALLGLLIAGVGFQRRSTMQG
ncbi:IPTL-CTERM sorting domain-containing protein [Comamonas sp. MYb69]|uniref:IPTL-CTERM sorting domain-containing protein n=1 Tax=Comamonas sp. MYb69 TaxID=1848650 RepID=UPI0030A8544A